MLNKRSPESPAQYIQDREDYLLAVSRFESGSKSISLKKLGEELGLVNKQVARIERSKIRDKENY